MLTLKKYLLTLLAGLGLLCAMSLSVLGLTASAADIAAASAIVLEPNTGTVLYEKDPDRQMLIASTTKIMTALVALERCQLSETVIPTGEETGVEGSSMGLAAGERYTVEELLYGLLLASGNDAAAALADHCGGSMEGFAALMNQKAAELGLENSHFMNAHGLDAEEHYSTARDLARLTAAAMKNPVFAEIFGTARREIHGVVYENHNQLLKTCTGCIGGKTGYTRAAGRILVSCAERDGMRLICVTISDPEDWKDHSDLYDELFARWDYIPIPAPAWQRLETVSGVRGFVRLVSDVPGFVVEKNRDTRMTVRLPRFVFAPVLSGAGAGTVELRVDNVLQRTAALRYGETVAKSTDVSLSAWERFRKMWFLSGGQGVYYLEANR